MRERHNKARLKALRISASASNEIATFDMYWESAGIYQEE
jgi:hypothetical protein